ncbi:MAG: AGE family epimerase/isomerase, partial [Planctomycetota bacterium]
MSGKYDEIIKANLAWFQNSGVMYPNDGHWGVAERIAVMSGNSASEQISKAFPCQTELADGVYSIDHRRADCCAETAYLFALAADYFSNAEYQKIADNNLDFLMKRSGLQVIADESSDHYGLWGWSMQVNKDQLYTDDDAWVATLFLLLSGKGRGDLKEAGVLASRAMQKLTEKYFSHIREHGRDCPFDITNIMRGMKLNPHWLGLLTMALAHATTVDPDTPYAETIKYYY